GERARARPGSGSGRDAGPQNRRVSQAQWSLPAPRRSQARGGLLRRLGPRDAQLDSRLSPCRERGARSTAPGVNDASSVPFFPGARAAACPRGRSLEAGFREGGRTPPWALTSALASESEPAMSEANRVGEVERRRAPRGGLRRGRVGGT